MCCNEHGTLLLRFLLFVHRYLHFCLAIFYLTFQLSCVCLCKSSGGSIIFRCFIEEYDLYGFSHCLIAVMETHPTKTSHSTITDSILISPVRIWFLVIRVGLGMLAFTLDMVFEHLWQVTSLSKGSILWCRLCPSSAYSLTTGDCYNSSNKRTHVFKSPVFFLYRLPPCSSSFFPLFLWDPTICFPVPFKGCFIFYGERSI